MNGTQFNGKSHGSEKSASGCLGRMVNLFDLTSSVSGNRLLTNKPHNDGSSLSRSQSYDSALPSFAGDEMEDGLDGIVSELRRSSPGKKPNGTPVKMLMAQEMSQDSDPRQNSPNVVARLMGLDALPQQHSDSGDQSRSQCYSRSSHLEKPIGYWREKHVFSNTHVNREVHRHLEQSEYKDIFEIWQQSQRKNCRRDNSPQNGRCSENISEKKLALIRQKFMEAKRLATDEKLRETKEFQDALDVLSSNGELFLKVLQEPNSLISRHHYADSIPPPTETKRITVLRPSKMVVDDKFAAPVKRNEKQTKKQPQVNHVWDSHNGYSPAMSTWKANDMPAQPTRIVLLKPSPARVNNTKASISTPSSPGIPQIENFFEGAEDEEAQEAREVAKEITLQMRENLAGHRRDETLLSSVLSNGYTGDESSFDKSENEFANGNLSDSEVMSPTSRHSWDYVNRYGSPCSSSFSRASYSPESSVCREAKKRLSERWAMLASNGNKVERHIRRSSSTLGEMLALSDIKKSEICVEEADDKDQDHRASTSCLNSGMGPRESGEDSPRSLSRSKSVPVSSTVYGGRLNVEVSDPILSKGDGSMEAMKTKASKSSFAGKVTSLFFSRNKKIRNEQSSKPQSPDEFQLVVPETSGNSAFPGRTRNEYSEVGLTPTSRLHRRSINGDLNDGRLGQGIFSQQGGLFVCEPSVPGIRGENQDHPSPISVLEPPFEEERATIDCFRKIEPNPCGGKQVSSCLSRSNLIDKSPPIGSIARTLSWDECSAETASSYPLNSPFISPQVKDNEAELRFLVQSLLKMAGLDNEGQMGPNFARWHSSESPLDPLLRDKYIDLTAKEPLHEAKRRHLRSTRKLVFDCVNAALIDITAVGTTASQWTDSHRRAHGGVMEGEPGALSDKVWGWMKGWLSGQVKLLSAVDEESGDSNSLVERVVRKEVVGKGWAVHMRLEIDKIGEEIEGKLIQELVEDAVVELTGRG